MGKGLRAALARPGVLGLLFCLCIVFFSWPILGAILSAPLTQAYFTLFAIWAVFVLFLLFISRAIANSGDRSEES